MRNSTVFAACSVVSVQVDPVAALSFGSISPPGRPLVVWIPKKIVKNVMQFEELEVFGRVIPKEDLELLEGAEATPTDDQARDLLGRMLEPQNSADKTRRRHQNVYKALTQSATRYAVRNLIMHFDRLMREWPDDKATMFDSDPLFKWKGKGKCRPREIQVLDSEESDPTLKYFCIPHVFPHLLDERKMLLPYTLTGIPGQLKNLWQVIAQKPTAAAKKHLLKNIAKWSVVPNFNAFGRDARQNLNVAKVFAKILAENDIEVEEVVVNASRQEPGWILRQFRVTNSKGQSVQNLVRGAVEDIEGMGALLGVRFQDFQAWLEWKGTAEGIIRSSCELIIRKKIE